MSGALLCFFVWESSEFLLKIGQVQDGHNLSYPCRPLYTSPPFLTYRCNTKDALVRPTIQSHGDPSLLKFGDPISKLGSLIKAYRFGVASPGATHDLPNTGPENRPPAHTPGSQLVTSS